MDISSVRDDFVPAEGSSRGGRAISTTLGADPPQPAKNVCEDGFGT